MGTNLANELAKERNRAAAERTLMAWIRTCLSLISFGFGLDKIIGAIQSSRLGGSSHAGLSVRLVAIGFVLTGILAMAAATRQHVMILQRLRRDDFLYCEPSSIGILTALALTVIGTVALILLISGAVGL
jgi:putative membrane protein